MKCNNINCSVVAHKTVKKQTWTFGNLETYGTEFTIDSNNKCPSPSCNGTLVLLKSTIKETTAETYWGNAINIVKALPVYKTLTVGNLITKNLDAFTLRCQQLYGYYKGKKNSNTTSTTRENTIKPAIMQFVKWLRKRTHFKAEEEGDYLSELTFCLTCRCGHHDCLSLGKFACHEVREVKNTFGETVKVNYCRGRKMYLRCSECEKKFAICHFIQWLSQDEFKSSEKLRDRLETCSQVCNRCFFNPKRKVREILWPITEKVGRKKTKKTMKRRRLLKDGTPDPNDEEEKWENLIWEDRKEKEYQDFMELMFAFEQGKAAIEVGYKELITSGRLVKYKRMFQELRKKVEEVDVVQDIKDFWGKVKSKRKLNQLTVEEKKMAEEMVKEMVYYSYELHKKKGITKDHIIVNLESDQNFCCIKNEKGLQTKVRFENKFIGRE
jgi:hypothetical protein